MNPASSLNQVRRVTMSSESVTTGPSVPVSVTSSQDSLASCLDGRVCRLTLAVDLPARTLVIARSVGHLNFNGPKGETLSPRSPCVGPRLASTERVAQGAKTRKPGQQDADRGQRAQSQRSVSGARGTWATLGPPRRIVRWPLVCQTSPAATEATARRWLGLAPRWWLASARPRLHHTDVAVWCMGSGTKGSG
jgi:hypothetical protein